MAKDILSVSSRSKGDEYFCSIVRIGELTPIENSDFLAVTNVNNIPIVVRKSDVKTGDVMFYAPIGSALCDGFLRINNMYELSERARNINANIVEPIMEEYYRIKDAEGKEAAEEIRLKARAMVGLFNQYGQVKQVVLKGILSSGFLFGIQEMRNYAPNIDQVDLNDMVGKDFDTVNGELFIKGFVPPVKEQQSGHGDRKGTWVSKIKHHNRLINGGIKRHYDTDLLNKPAHLSQIHPNDSICISTKIHGTSVILGNTQVKTPKFGGVYAQMFYRDWLPKCMRWTKVTDAVIYSTRNNIINKDMNPKVNDRALELKTTKVYAEYYELLKNYIPTGMTIYGEIFGYKPGVRNKYIQKNYDYGCELCTNKLMIYRITQALEGTAAVKEYNVMDVTRFVDMLIKEHPELEKRLMKMDILYHGKARDLFPEIEIDEDWSINFLNALRGCKKFHMEENEPLCKNKVPREGVVVRIDDDAISRAFKVKCQKFLGLESKAIEKGTYEDMEVYDAELNIDGEDEAEN